MLKAALSSSLTSLLLILTVSASAADKSKDEETIKNATTVLQAMLSSKAVPDSLQFPDHEDLAALDPSDRKFVSVANAHANNPPILQATDSKWWGWKEALSACGITVEFLCPKEIQETYERKMAGCRA